MQPTTSPALYERGILLHTGEINKDKINLISGATTDTFIETLWEVSGHNADTLNRLYSILSDLHEQEREDDMMEILRLLYDALDMDIPDDIALLAEHPEARNYYLFELLLDIDDLVPQLLSEV